MKFFFLLASKPNIILLLPGPRKLFLPPLFKTLLSFSRPFPLCHNFLSQISLLNASGWKDLQGIWKQKKVAKLLLLREDYSSINHLFYVSESSDGANKWACLLPCLNSFSGRPIPGWGRWPALKLLLFCLKNITFSHPLEHCTLYTAR